MDQMTQRKSMVAWAIGVFSVGREFAVFLGGHLQRGIVALPSWS
jgi:hypothetical protein